MQKYYVFSLGPLKGSTLISHLARQNHLVSKMVTSLFESRKYFLNGGQDWKQTSHAQKSLSPYNIKIYIRHVQHCHLNERVQQLQHNAAAQLTPPPPHTAYEQLATMVHKIPRNNLITHSAQNISPPPHSSPNPSIPQYISPGSTATTRIQKPTNFIQAQAAKTLREMEGVHVSRLSLVSNISFSNHSKFRTFMSPNPCHYSLSSNS